MIVDDDDGDDDDDDDDHNDDDHDDDPQNMNVRPKLRLVYEGMGSMILRGCQLEETPKTT